MVPGYLVSPRHRVREARSAPLNRGHPAWWLAAGMAQPQPLSRPSRLSRRRKQSLVARTDDGQRGRPDGRPCHGTWVVCDKRADPGRGIL